MISSNEYIERRVQGRPGDRKEDGGEEGTVRKERQIGETFSWLACHSADAFAYYYGH